VRSHERKRKFIEEEPGPIESIGVVHGITEYHIMEDCLTSLPYEEDALLHKLELNATSKGENTIGNLH